MNFMKNKILESDSKYIQGDERVRKIEAIKLL